jgi:ACDE family multidrug resistance protein
MLLKSYPSKLLSHDAELRIILCLALVAVLGVSSIAPVLPHLMDVFHITKQKVAWLITIFTLPGIFFSLFFGVLVDRLGCKKILIPSLTLFAVSGLLCAFTTQFSILLALRFIQGSTATAIGVINLTLITHLYEGKKKTAVMGLSASVLSIGTATYPLLGGALALISWRLPFTLAIFAFFVMLYARRHLKQRHVVHDDSLHFFKYLNQVFHSVKNRSAAMLITAMICVFILIYGICLTVFPIMMKIHFQATPFVIGLFLTLMSAGTAVAAWQLKHLTGIMAERFWLMACFLAYAAVCAVLPFIHHLYLLVIPCLVVGVCNGILVPMLQTMISNRAPKNSRGAFMSFSSLAVRLGQTLGPVLMSIGFYFFEVRFVFLIGSFIGLFVVLLFAGLKLENA